MKNSSQITTGVSGNCKIEFIQSKITSDLDKVTMIVQSGDNQDFLVNIDFYAWEKKTIDAIIAQLQAIRENLIY